MNNKKASISVIGATGMVGRELLRILEERAFTFSKLKLFASAKSAGQKLTVGDDDYLVEELKDAAQIDTALAFFAAGSEISKKYLKKAASLGVICIDKSSYMRMNPDIPLVVSGVNDHAIKNSHIITIPNCIATPLVQALAPLHKLYELSQVIVCTYQAVSGAGKAGFNELESQVRDLFNLRDIKSSVFGKRIAFNVLPYIPALGGLDDLGKSDEESKIIEETQKILEIPNLAIDATCVRVPVFNGHSLAVHIATKKPCKISQALHTLKSSAGIIVIDDTEKISYPTPLDASGNDMTYVGRVRPNTAVPHGLSFWIASDNLRTGAALNAVRIAETITME
jgi:aspartate-semialdehyde dehydrogenase